MKKSQSKEGSVFRTQECTAAYILFHQLVTGKKKAPKVNKCQGLRLVTDRL